MVYPLFFIAFAFLFFFGLGLWLSGPKYRGPVSDHFDGKKFINPGNVEAKGMKDVLKWMLNRQKGEWKELKDMPYGEKPESRIDSGIRITFINHTSFLIQVDGINILTDPVYSKRASPFTWSGPKRMRPPGIRFDDLPPIDLVLLSHNHYDHLDLDIIKKLHDKFHPNIYTALGIRSLLAKNGISKSVDMDWWNEEAFNNNLKIVALPAQHFSGRGMFDRDATLWCGFAIKCREGNIYFAADTGYNEASFKEIGRRFSPIRLSILPIGAYKPKWFMQPVHCSPDEAVKIHLDVKSKTSIGSHFGTFPLADEGMAEPVTDLKNALKEMNVPENDFIVLKEGTWMQF